MKKKLLLGLLPALLVLASCQASPRVEQKPNLDNIVEDTDAHDEIFGESEFSGKLAIKKEYDGNVVVPEDTDTSYPALGIQAKIDDKGTVDASDDEVSIRFVAAIKVEDTNGDDLIDDSELAATDAVWSRTIFKEDGTVSKASAIKASTKAYTSIAAPNDVENDGVDDNILTIDEFNDAKSGREYTHFVVYTLLDIPLAYYGSYYVVIELDAGGSESEVLATTIDLATQFVFLPYINAHPLNEHYFAVKKSGSGFDVVDAAATPGSGNLAKFEAVALNAGEDFVVVHRVVKGLGSNDDIFEVFGYDKLVRTNADFQEGTNGGYLSNNMFDVKHNGTYNILLKSGTNKIEIEKKIYFQGPDFWEDDSAKAMINLKHDDGGSGEFKTFEMDSTGYSHQYYAFFDISYYTHCEFYRGIGETGYSWSGMKDVPLTGEVLFNYNENYWYNV